MGPYRLRVKLAQQYTNPSQLEIGRSVALGISTLRGGINPGDISVFVSGLSELYICTGRPGGVSGYPRAWYRSVS